MPVPTVVDMLRPILALAAEAPIKRRQAGDAMMRHFSLTLEEQQTRIASGGLMMPHRVQRHVDLLDLDQNYFEDAE